VLTGAVFVEGEASVIDIYDSEVATLQEVLATLKGRTGKSHNLDAFDREIVERFGEAGFKVKVNWFDTDQRGVFIPEIEVLDRCDPIKAGEFDHDRLRHEIVNNHLGLPSEDAGIIKTPESWTPDKAKEIHKQGSDCDH